MDFLRNVVDGHVVAVEENSQQRSDYLTQRTPDERFPLYEQISQIQIGQPYPVSTEDYGSSGFSNVHIFEVTDLTIPAGTNWGNGGSFPAPSTARIIGEFDLDSMDGLIASFSIETDTEIVGTDEVFLVPGEPEGGMLRNRGANVGENKLFDYTDGFTEGNSLLASLVSYQNPQQMRVSVGFLVGPNGPLVSPVHVVRARAAFLVV